MSKETFKQFPRLEAYYKTSDGNKFFKEHDAKVHAKKLKNRKVTKVERAEDKDTKKPTETQRIKSVQTLKTVAEVEAVIEVEKSEKVLEVAYKRIEELEASK